MSSKSKKNHDGLNQKHLSAEQKKLGKNHLYLLLGMIVVGGIIGIYFINQTH